MPKLGLVPEGRQLSKVNRDGPVANHCEKLAQFYEDAAKEAEFVSTELSK